jgi:hypothetical protein
MITFLAGGLTASNVMQIGAEIIINLKVVAILRRQFGKLDLYASIYIIHSFTKCYMHNCTSL